MDKNLNSLALTHPDVAARWHPSMNGELTPQDVSYGSKRKAWWLCHKCGHEWQALVSSQTYGSGCPACAGKVVRIGVNDLATTHPELIEEWHPTMNGDLTPEDVTFGSNRKVWWLCGRGHEWQATVVSRAKGAGCSACSRGYSAPRFCRVVGENSLATARPEIAAQWHPTKNGGLTPQRVTRAASRVVWWLCEKCGHEWQATVGSRAKGSGCPVCAGKVVRIGVNDLATTHPDIAAQWHPTKNNGLSPQDVSHGSNMRAWWVCDKGHEWEVPVYKRAQGNGCPVCAGKVVRVGVNDLATTHPGIAAQWHPTKNGGLTPQDVSRCVRRRVWWVCDKGHEWQAAVLNRTCGTGCPACYRQSRNMHS